MDNGHGPGGPVKIDLGTDGGRGVGLVVLGWITAGALLILSLRGAPEKIEAHERRLTVVETKLDRIIEDVRFVRAVLTPRRP